MHVIQREESRVVAVQIACRICGESTNAPLLDDYRCPACVVVAEEFRRVLHTLTRALGSRREAATRIRDLAEMEIVAGPGLGGAA